MDYKVLILLVFYMACLTFLVSINKIDMVAFLSLIVPISQYITYKKSGGGVK